ncbi:MAG: hypothetical protein U0Z26_16560 [Anaerolineales bacterium]
MSIRYNISTKLNLIIYPCDGLITGSELLKTARLAYVDERRRYGMISIIDLLSAKVDFDLQDLHQFVSWANELKANGFEPEQIVILTQNKGLHLTSEALNFMSSKVTLKLSIFESLENAIASLGLSEFQHQILQFWEESKFSSEKS